MHWLRYFGSRTRDLLAPIETGESKSHRYAGLDLLRGVAALVVVLKHFVTRLELPYVAPNAYLAVDFFFVLSGFVIAGAYWKPLESGNLPVGGFTGKRLIRLLPLIFVGTSIAALIELGRPEISDELQHLTDIAIAFVFGITAIPLLQTSMLHTVTLEQTVFPLNTPTWSLFFEIFVNIAFAMWARARIGQAAMWLVLAASGIVLLLAIVRTGNANFGFRPSEFWYGFPRVIWSFSIGLLIYKHRDFAPSKCFALATIVLITILLLPDLGLPKAGLDAICIAVIMPAVVFFSLSARLGPATRRVAMWCGNLSYPVYAVHYPLVRAISFVATELHLSWMGQLTVIVVGTVFIVGLSAIVYLVFDVPFRRKLSVLSKGA